MNSYNTLYSGPSYRIVNQTFLLLKKFPTMSQPFAILLTEQAVRQYVKQWNAGLKPCLLLETHGSGAVFMSFKVSAGVTLPNRLKMSLLSLSTS